MAMPRHGCSLAVDTLLNLSKKRPLLFKYCGMLLIQHGLHHAWKNAFQPCVTLNVDFRPPSTCVFANTAGSIATSTSFDCVAFSVVPVYEFLNNAGPVP
jgi:hypothetical protein